VHFSPQALRCICGSRLAGDEAGTGNSTLDRWPLWVESNQSSVAAIDPKETLANHRFRLKKQLSILHSFDGISLNLKAPIWWH
jgi:hypothetical protein